MNKPKTILGKNVVYRTPFLGKRKIQMLEIDKDKGVYMTVPQYRQELRK